MVLCPLPKHIPACRSEFLVQQHFVQTNFWVQNFWAKQIWGAKPFGQNVWIQKRLVPKTLASKKFVPKSLVGIGQVTAEINVTGQMLPGQMGPWHLVKMALETQLKVWSKLVM